MIPRVATYRLQLSPAFGFAEAAEVVPDLARLGVSHLYLSPVAEAVTGSTHGYDVVDPALVRAELGGRDALWELARRARHHGLGIVVDMVPNHVSIAEPHRNRWWCELLRDGRRSPPAEYFDVDWEVGGGRVIVPTLAHPVEEEVAAGALVVGDVDATPMIRYHDRSFPLRVDSEQQGPVDALLAAQHYRLTPWFTPARNVRRFFTVDDLAAIRPEVPAVRDAVARIVRELAADGLLDGVRLDHVDGLGDPRAVLAELRELLGDAAWILVEKILVGEETLPRSWEADGTTGYEWITLVDHLYTHPAGVVPLRTLWEEMTGDPYSYRHHEREGIRAVLNEGLAPDLARVVNCAMDELAQGGHAVAAAELRAAIVAVTVELGRYRTYLPDDEEGRAVILRAAGRAETAEPALGRALRAFVEVVLAAGATTHRWQQLTGPALAKGAEDRALYRWLPLAAHNEVGGDPTRWTTAPAEFHDHNRHVATAHPTTLLAASTHDTKRSEDVRARLLVLAEVAERWATTLRDWRAIAREELAPDHVDGWSFVVAAQTAVGAWPIDAERLTAYLVKAAREAELSTGWQRPAVGFESTLGRTAELFTAGALSPHVADFVGSIEDAARAIALAQLALRMTAPGVPDFYQCSESWLHTLVDPDNRRPIDPTALRAEVDIATNAETVWSSSSSKAALVHRLLGMRGARRACFGPGAGYEALTAQGPHADHVISFVRSAGDLAVVTVVSRFPLSRPDGWGATEIGLPAGDWRDVLGRGGVVAGETPLSVILGDGPDERPAAVLDRVGDRVAGSSDRQGRGPG